MSTKFLKVNPRVVFIFVLTILMGTAWAGDERSIKELRDAVVALSPDVDPGEAELFSVTVHTMARSLAKEYRLVWCPPFQNLLINMGVRQRGYCAHFVRDIGTRLRELKFKTLVLHWGAAYAGQADESNCLVVTARNQVFQNGIVIDAWRRGGGRLFWCALKSDHEDQLEQHYGHSGVTAWKEDMQETAWLQDSGPSKTEPQEATATVNR